MLKKHNCLQVIENTYLKETKIIKASTQRASREDKQTSRVME